MACNCSKNRTPPTGLGYSSYQEQLTAQEQQRAAQAQEAERRSSMGRSAPAGMTTQSGTQQSFALKTSDGSTQRFSSRLEAQAARVRAGGGTITPL